MKIDKNTIILIIVVLVLAVIAVFLIASPGFYRDAIPHEEETLTGQEIILEIRNGEITPSNFTVLAGKQVRLTVVSVEGEHLFEFEKEDLPRLGDDFKKEGAQAEIVFTAPDEEGEYFFYCPDHREYGEKGTMIVKEE